MRLNQGGSLCVLNYAEVSSVAVDPIEKKPLFHFYPASQVFSLGTWGCNFHCKHCQNWQISFADPREGLRESYHISPEESIFLAKEHSCRGIAWTYNEPGIWFEYTLDSARLAKEKGLYTVYVTNGFLTPEALDEMGPYLDAYRVDIKGFTPAFYRALARVNQMQGILDVAVRAKEKWNMHVEVVTNIIPGMNDDEAQLRGIANWVRDALGELTPWHVTRFYPHHELRGVPPTPLETLERAWKIGRQAGLRFIYMGNVSGHGSENTTCYSCGNLVVERMGYRTRLLNLKGSCCGLCGADLNIRNDC